MNVLEEIGKVLDGGEGNFGGAPAEPDDKIWQVTRAEAIKEWDALPKSIPSHWQINRDGRQLPVFTQSGATCTGWAHAAMKTAQEWQEAKFDPAFKFRTFDGQRIYDRNAESPESGLSIPPTMEDLRRHGAERFENGAIVRYKIRQWAVIEKHPDALRAAIYRQGAGVMASNLTREFVFCGDPNRFHPAPGQRMAEPYSVNQAIHHTGDPDRDRYAGTHCMAYVGYTPDGIILQNSWGTGWGDNGLILVGWDYIEASCMEFSSAMDLWNHKGGRI